METYQKEQDLTDEQLDEQIEQMIDGDEEETSEEPVEDNSEEESEDSDESRSEEEKVISDLEEESEAEEPEEQEESEDEEEPSEELMFKSQRDAEKSYQNLLILQKRQATELGEIRKQLAEKKETSPTSEENELSNLSNDDLAELVITDPAKAVEVMQEQIMRKMAEQQQTQVERERRAKMISDSEAAIDEFFKQDAYKNMDDAQQEAFFGFIKKHHNTNEALTVKDLTDYHKWMNYDTNLEQAQINARGKTIKDLNDASPKVKTLSNAAGSKAKGKPQIKEGMTREQVQAIAEQMDDEELTRRIEALDEL